MKNFWLWYYTFFIVSSGIDKYIKKKEAILLGGMLVAKYDSEINDDNFIASKL